jgi:hypothetical protein
MNSIDLSLVRLSDSIRFTRKLLDDGNDVELMTVGMQAKEALEGLSTMEWNRDAVRPSLLRLKFAPAVEDMKTFGKVLNTIQSSDILIENVPQNSCVDDKLEFSVKLSDEIAARKYDATTLLSITVTHNERKIPVAIQSNGPNNWSVSCTPQDGGEHTINVKLGQFSSQSCKLPVRAVVLPRDKCSTDSWCTKLQVKSSYDAAHEGENLPIQHKKGGRRVSKPSADVPSYVSGEYRQDVARGDTSGKSKPVYYYSRSDCVDQPSYPVSSAEKASPPDHYSSTTTSLKKTSTGAIEYRKKVPAAFMNAKKANW